MIQSHVERNKKCIDILKVPILSGIQVPILSSIQEHPMCPGTWVRKFIAVSEWNLLKWRLEMPVIHLCKLSVRYIGAHRRCKISCKYSAISIVPSFKYFALYILCLKKSRSAREFSSQDTHAFELCRGPRKPCSRAIFKENFFGRYWSSSHSKGAVPLRMFAPDWSLRPSFLFSSWDKLLYK